MFRNYCTKGSIFSISPWLNPYTSHGDHFKFTTDVPSERQCHSLYYFSAHNFDTYSDLKKNQSL